MGEGGVRLPGDLGAISCKWSVAGKITNKLDTERATANGRSLKQKQGEKLGAKWLKDAEDVRIASNRSSNDDSSDEKEGDDKFEKGLNMISKGFTAAAEQNRQLIEAVTAKKESSTKSSISLSSDHSRPPPARAAFASASAGATGSARGSKAPPAAWALV